MADAPAICSDTNIQNKNSEIRLSEVISAMSCALDMTEGQPEGHAARSCLVGMRIAAELSMSAEDRSALFYALQLKDLGCSSNAAKICSLFAADDRSVKRNVKLVNTAGLLESAAFIFRTVAPGRSFIQRSLKAFSIARSGESGAKELIQTRCERGADIAKQLEFPEATGEAILGLDEHWDGKGQPLGLCKDEIPLMARIACLAQTAEVFFSNHGKSAMYEMARERSGSWFDPELVKVLESFRNDQEFWSKLTSDHLVSNLNAVEPMDYVLTADEQRLDRVAEGFARVVDAKSPWTFKHSEGVAEIAVGISETLGFSVDRKRELRRAGLLHDIGKLGISNLILDKQGKLTDDEFAQMKRHAEFSQRILERVACFRELSDYASAHHERMDGRGYFRGLAAEDLTIESRVLAVADVFEALSAKRPYRDQFPQEKVLQIMRADVSKAFCPEAFEGLIQYQERTNAMQRIEENVGNLQNLCDDLLE